MFWAIWNDVQFPPRVVIHKSPVWRKMKCCRLLQIGCSQGITYRWDPSISLTWTTLKYHQSHTKRENHCLGGNIWIWIQFKFQIQLFFLNFASPVSWFLMSLSLTRSVLLSVRSKAMFARAQRPSQAIGHRTISSDCFKMLIRLPHPASSIAVMQ